MSVRIFLIKLGATFVSAVLGNLGMAQVLGVEEWKAALMSGGYVVLEVVRKLAMALRDGSLTNEEATDIFLAIEIDQEKK